MTEQLLTILLVMTGIACFAFTIINVVVTAVFVNHVRDKYHVLDILTPIMAIAVLFVLSIVAMLKLHMGG